jgi:adenylate kinase
MRVICTGISGTGRLDWLRQVAELARGRGLDVAVYDVRETMFEIGRAVGEPVEEETILDMFPRALVLLRAAALESICSSIEADPNRHWILNTHAVFRWKNTLISGFDPHYLTRLNPHLFVTVTAGFKTSVARLRTQARWAHLDEDQVLTWREEEQFFTEEMARIHRKPQFLLPRPLPAEVGYQLLFEPTRFKAYLSYPMQHVAANEERGLAAFKARLAERVIVFDPGDVNDFVDEDRRSRGLIGKSGAGRREVDALVPTNASDGSTAVESVPETESLPVRRDPLQQHIADQIVERDYKLIAQSDVVVVYYDVPVPSPGVISEMKFALESGKRVYGVWLPANEPSVFFTRYCSLWFRTPEAVIDQLSADVQPSLQDDAVVSVGKT